MSGEHLIDVTRGELVESTHVGHIAVVNSEGTLLYFNGDPDRVTFARSSMKPLQAVPIVETGAMEFYNLDAADLSLACASHSGEAQHTDRVLTILDRLELTTEDLQCGTHPPRWQEAYEKLMREGKEVTPEFNNCSGKHSGMLATAKFMQESLQDYYKIEHPVQQRVIEVISDIAQVPADEIKIGVDGCGLPVHGIPLKNLALAFARMANPISFPEKRKKAIEKVTESMMAAPEMVGGTDRFCTDLMKCANGQLFGKAGAEGVYCIGDKETGIGIAIKVEDGNGRAASPVAMEVLKQLNLLNENQLQNLENHHYPKLTNARQEVIGQLSPNFSLKNALSILS
ncbi:asparaginase [Sporosarcina sp. HYO08]|uniref:asparaginase n=1 Tax=Sporosarcina sp. HYO08 TaxID=1759557 RepID=UPI00079655DF|nr:asparaginase [Sporosarcina sp. HYO08]KXH84071.1 L-asparaginase [Sporosarcina sp. HYO08]